MSRAWASIRRLAAVLAVLSCPVATEAADLFREPSESAGPFQTGGAGFFALDDPSFGSDSLRLAVEPLRSTGSEPPSRLYLAAFDSPPAIPDAAAEAASQERHWSSLPLLGDLARERGYELPLPFGVTAAYNYVARDIEVTDVRVGANGAALRSVTPVANFKATSVVNAAVTKVDAWILPFLNLYALLGYIDNRSDVHVRVDVPRPGPLPGNVQTTIKAKTHLEGFVGGGGLSLAAGYREFFAMLDANYTQTDLGFDDRFRALIVSGRVGWNGKLGPVPFRVWGGAAYWDTENTAKGTVEIPDVGSLRFEADQGPKFPWNAVVGVSAAVHRHVELFAEYGFNFNDVTFFAGGLTFRF